MKIALLSMYNEGIEPLGRFTTTGKIEYCHRHGYDYIIKTKDFNTERHVYLSKIKFLMEQLPHFDWIFWCDADAIIMNHTIKLESLFDDADILMTKDFNGLNNGVFLIKNTHKSMNFLEQIWEWKEDVKLTGIAGDVDQVPMVLLPKRRPGIINMKFVPQRTFNSYLLEYYPIDPQIPVDYAAGEFQYGDFILHMPGLTDDLRLSVFDEYRNKIIKTTGDMLGYLHMYNNIAGHKFRLRSNHQDKTLLFEDTHEIKGEIGQHVWCLKCFNQEILLFIMGMKSTYEFGNLFFFHLKNGKWIGKNVAEKMSAELMPA